MATVTKCDCHLASLFSKKFVRDISVALYAFQSPSLGGKICTATFEAKHMNSVVALSDVFLPALVRANAPGIAPTHRNICGKLREPPKCRL